MKSLMDLTKDAFDVLESMAEDDCGGVSSFVDGAAVAFGLMGMAEAIRHTDNLRQAARRGREPKPLTAVRWCHGWAVLAGTNCPECNVRVPL